MTDHQAKTFSLFVVCEWRDRNVPALSKAMNFLVAYGGGMARQEALAHAERQSRELEDRLHEQWLRHLEVGQLRRFRFD